MAHAPEHDNEELRHRDLSRKELSQLTAEERRELKRRLAEFVQAVRPAIPKAPAPAKRARVVKWHPQVHARRAQRA